MTEHNRQFDDLERHVSDRFRKDLRSLFESTGSVPPQVDRAILDQARRRLAKPRRIVLRIRWAGGIAAAAAMVALGVVLCHGPASSNRQFAIDNHPSAVVSSGEGTSLTIESTDGGGRIMPGTGIRTSAGETRSLVLNGRHHVTMNAGTRLSVEPLVEMGRTGCLVHLALGEVYVHVDHDGNPFIVQTAHGRAVITGTTFDVKATKAGTTLVVAEGSVRFESQAGAVLVAAGQRSMIAAASLPPGMPALCDAAALTAWAGADQSTDQLARILSLKDTLLDSLPLFPSLDTRTNLESISYTQWAEQNRNWFERQFPDVFRLEEALADEGIEVDYPDLLLESGALWQFAYPPASRDRLLAPGNTAVTAIASRYGKDLRWLRNRGLLPIPGVAPAGQKRRMEAFTLWQNELATILDSGREVPEDLLADSLHACVYLRQTRSLIWLAAEAGRYSLPNWPKAQLQGFLQDEINAAEDGVSEIIQLLTAEQSVLPCDSDLYRRSVKALREAITQITQTEMRWASDQPATWSGIAGSQPKAEKAQTP